jgi:hypothetical protein
VYAKPDYSFLGLVMRIDTETTINFGMGVTDVAIIPDVGASVKVEYFSGLDWIEPVESPITAPDTFFACGLVVRLTPAGGGCFLGYIA